MISIATGVSLDSNSNLKLDYSEKKMTINKDEKGQLGRSNNSSSQLSSATSSSAASQQQIVIETEEEWLAGLQGFINQGFNNQ